jgi:Fe-S-cluster containining protein
MSEYVLNVDKFIRAKLRQFTAIAQLVTGDADARADMESRVPCGSCNACCKIYDVDLCPWESGAGLDYHVDANGKRVLRRNADGSCVHLIDNRCSVYAQRPLTCATYDCRTMSIAGVTIKGSPELNAQELNAAIMRFKPRLKSKRDRELHDKIRFLTHGFVTRGVPAEMAAQNAVLIVGTYPIEDWPRVCEETVERQMQHRMQGGAS